MRVVYLLVFAPQFDPYTLRNDLCIVVFYPKYEHTLALFPIGLIYQETKINNKQGLVTGWGRCDFTGRELCLPKSTKYFPNEITDPMLRTVTIQIKTDNDYCQEYVDNDIPIPEGTLCLGTARHKQTVAPCMAVPGAPIVVNGRLLGLQSWGFGCGYSNDLPIVYTSIVHHICWIHDTIGILNQMNHDNVTSIVNATKIILILKALEGSNTKSVLNTEEHKKEMVAHDVDEDISEIEGQVLDFRDFFDGGALRNEKAEIYEAMSNRTKIMKDKMKRREHLTKKRTAKYDDFIVTIHGWENMDDSKEQDYMTDNNMVNETSHYDDSSSDSEESTEDDSDDYSE